MPPHLQPLEFAPVEIIHEHYAESTLQRVLTGELPAFVMQHTTYDRNWLPTYRQTLQEYGFHEHSMNYRELGTTDTLSDLGWHNDGRPTPNIPVQVVHDHITAAGRATVRLVIPRPNLDLPFEEGIAATKSLEQGLINPDIYEPTGLSANLRPGSRLFFVARGHQPLMHSFETIEGPRRITVRTIHKG